MGSTFSHSCIGLFYHPYFPPKLLECVKVPSSRSFIKLHHPFVCFGNSFQILSNFPLPTQKQTRTHTHTHSPLVWCTDEMKTNTDRGVNISKCWLHKKAASENSCRDLRARGSVCWPMQLQQSQGPTLLRVHWACVQIIRRLAGWSLPLTSLKQKKLEMQRVYLRPTVSVAAWEIRSSEINVNQFNKRLTSLNVKSTLGLCWHIR